MPATRAKTPARDTAAEVAFLTRALKAPTLRESIPRLAERARSESWTHEEFLIACLQREVAARDSHGGEGRIRAARFPARKSLEEFDYDHARTLKRDTIAHLGTLDFVTARENVVFLGPPGTGKTHLATGLAIRACQAGHRVLFATAAASPAATRPTTKQDQHDQRGSIFNRRWGVNFRASLTTDGLTSRSSSTSEHLRARRSTSCQSSSPGSPSRASTPIPATG